MSEGEYPFSSSSFKPLFNNSMDINETLAFQIQASLPDERIIANNDFIISRMNIFFKDIQHNLSRRHINLHSLHLYGSQLSGLALRCSDIDMTILTDHHHSNRIAKELYQEFDRMNEAQFLRLGFLRKFNMRLCYHPIIDMYFLRFFNIETYKMPAIRQCLDLTVNGSDGIRNSLMLRHLADNSSTFRDMTILIKSWAKRFSPQSRMGAYAYYLMLIHFLQHVSDPKLLSTIDLSMFSISSIFPNGRYIKDDVALRTVLDSNAYRNISVPQMSELLAGFFKYYGINYHREAQKPRIWFETINGDTWNSLRRHKGSFVFDIEDPFVDYNPGCGLVENRAKSIDHLNEMKRACEALVKGENIYTKSYMDKALHLKDLDDPFFQRRSSKQRKKSVLKMKKKLKAEEKKVIKSVKLTKKEVIKEIENEISIKSRTKNFRAKKEISKEDEFDDNPFVNYIRSKKDGNQNSSMLGGNLYVKRVSRKLGRYGFEDGSVNDKFTGLHTVPRRDFSSFLNSESLFKSTVRMLKFIRR